MTQPDQPEPEGAAPTQVWALTITAEAEVVPGEPPQQEETP